jgi:hypothetical protein
LAYTLRESRTGGTLLICQLGRSGATPCTRRARPAPKGTLDSLTSHPRATNAHPSHARPLPFPRRLRVLSHPDGPVDA